MCAADCGVSALHERAAASALEDELRSWIGFVVAQLLLKFLGWDRSAISALSCVSADTRTNALSCHPRLIYYLARSSIDFVPIGSSPHVGSTERSACVYITGDLLDFPHPNIPETDRGAGVAVGLQQNRRAIVFLIKRLANI